MSEEAKTNPLDAEQQTELNKTKVAQKLKDEKYIRSHPEIDDLISLFVEATLEKKPEDILNFAGDFFTADDLKERVQSRLEGEGDITDKPAVP